MHTLMLQEVLFEDENLARCLQMEWRSLVVSLDSLPLSGSELRETTSVIFGVQRTRVSFWFSVVMYVFAAP